MKAGDKVLVDFTDQKFGECPCKCGRTGRYLGTVVGPSTASNQVVVRDDTTGKTFHERTKCVHPRAQESS